MEAGGAAASPPRRCRRRLLLLWVEVHSLVELLQLSFCGLWKRHRRPAAALRQLSAWGKRLAGQSSAGHPASKGSAQPAMGPT